MQELVPLQIDSLIGKTLSTEAFFQLCGEMAGYPYVKVVIDRQNNIVHFLNDNRFKLHAKYIASNILQIAESTLVKNIDKYNQLFYYGENRPYYLGIISLIKKNNKSIFILESLEVDDMKSEMILDFYNSVKASITPGMPLFLKPANYDQEEYVVDLDKKILPRIYIHELMQNKSYIPLNVGETRGRIRIFKDYKDYKKSRHTLKWFDIIAMNKVPEDIPRLSGIINGEHTAPLSHTNILATGWQIPNCIQIDALKDFKTKKLNRKWVKYIVDRNSASAFVEQIDPPKEVRLKKPTWATNRVKLIAPEVKHTEILPLENLRKNDNNKYGTKASNLGEVHHLLNKGSHRILGFYQVDRWPRPNLLEFAAKNLGVPNSPNLKDQAWKFLNEFVKVPRGISIPFSLQQKFLESSPQIQQTIGKLKMALELNAKEIDSLCVELQSKIRKTRFNDELWERVDSMVETHLSGCKSFVVRSSSNAEDLQNFSAAGIYESYNHITTSENILRSIKDVWASLVSPRSVRLRQEVGMSLDDCYMGVIIQEEIEECDLGGVLVTANPLNTSHDYRNVYINASEISPNKIVEGTEKSFQLLFNIVEGGGRTIVKDETAHEITHLQKQALKKLAFAGKLLQSHFSPDDTFNQAVDIEWVLKDNQLFLLQIRPYSIE